MDLGDRSMSETSDNIVRGKFRHYKAPPLPERKAQEEKAHISLLSERLSNFLVEAELRLGLSATRQMLVVALGWIDMRKAYKRGAK
jgi:hypothetical protein